MVTMPRASSNENTVTALLHHQAAADGQAAALLAPCGQALSRMDLSRGTHAVVERLRAAGVARADRVAVIAPNGPDMALAVLGTLAGAACAPVSPQHSRGELDLCIDDLDVRAIVVTPDSPSLARDAARARGLPLIEAGTELCSQRFEGEVDEASPDDIALVLHTSGTTSRPKQVPLSQANLASSMRHVMTSLALRPDDCALNAMPLFHIHGLVAGLLAPLAAGGRTVCAPGLQLPAFFDWIDVCGVTWFTAVPTMHQAVLAAAGDRRPKKPLRFIRSSSAALAPATLGALERHFNCPVIEAYGMTEAAHQMASNPLPPQPRKPGSVGRPAGPCMTILDAGGTELGPGTRGEIAIRGHNVMRGYHANPDANRNAFSGDWFRTGDEGYFDADGFLFITGRLKDMINRGGEKIAPREIDEALLGHPDVAQALAFAVPHATLGEDVAAAVVLRPHAATDAAQLRAYLFERLTHFKVPSELLVVDEIPMGATGKMQRIGMAERLAGARRSPREMPRDVVERVLAQAWAAVLEHASPGIRDNFFSLGGDSLQAARVAARVTELLPVDLPTTLLFRHPTIAELAGALRHQMGARLVAELEALIGVADGHADAA